MIKIANQRATVSPEFILVSKDTARGKIARFKEYLTTVNPHMKEHVLNDSKGLLMNAGKMVRSPEVWDNIVTRLRCLEYTEFNVVEASYRTYNHDNFTGLLLHGRTKNVVINQWLLGPYDVYIPVADILANRFDSFHFIPVKAPNTWDRHVHHTASDTSPSPLRMRPYTCWGGFNGIISAVLYDFDLVEIFRNIWIYLNRYDASSPLRHIGEISWKELYRENCH